MVNKNHLDPVTNTVQAVSPPSLGKLEQDVPGTDAEVAVPWEGVRDGGENLLPTLEECWIRALPRFGSWGRAVQSESSGVGGKCTLSHVWVSVVFNFFRV